VEYIDWPTGWLYGKEQFGVALTLLTYNQEDGGQSLPAPR
jgi:hypothetical protein